MLGRSKGDSKSKSSKKPLTLYDPDASLWKQTLFEPFRPARTEFQSLWHEILDTVLGFFSCLLLVVAAYFASTSFFYWKDTGKSPTVWPRNAETDLIPEAAKEDALEK